ncbi:MAG: response regulator transcription factor [Peptostreptococcaceae bacterium]|nr:response regulator transcription factor [Peptostreptococcaceae bacterium]
MTTSILIVEDEPKIARFLELEFTHEGYEVSIAEDGRKGLKAAESNKYDLILLDLMIPGLNGIEVCRRIRQFSDIPIIMVTAKDDIMDKVTGLDTGADDYVTKPFAIEELLARMRSVMKRRGSSPSIKSTKSGSVAVGSLSLSPEEHKVLCDSQEIDLTKREFDLLEYLIRNKNMVLTREQILENVWGYDYFGDTNVVDVYIRYLRSKIDEPFDHKFITTVRGVGYSLKDE